MLEELNEEVEVYHFAVEVVIIIAHRSANKELEIGMVHQSVQGGNCALKIYLRELAGRI